MRRGTRRAIALLAGLALVAAACGDSADEPTATADGAAVTETTAEAAAESADTTEAQSTETTEAEVASEPVSFQIAMGSPGLSGALLQEALKRVNEKYGHEGEFVEIADSDLVVQGAAQGDFEMGSSSTASVMQVIQEGAPLRFVAELAGNQWTLMAKEGIESCADIDGLRLGLHSPGGVSTALYRAWYARNCTDEAPNELYIEGSPNRLQALLADQVDVSMIELEDTLDLPEDGYTMLANFSESLSDIKVGLIYANQNFIDEHRDVVQALVTELIALQQEVNEDPALFEEIAREYVPETGDKIPAAVQAYIDVGLIPTDGGMTAEDIQSSIELYTEAGRLEPGITPEEMVDTSFIEQALKATS